MNTLSRKYALLALVVLALGVGLIAAAPAQALVVYNDIPDVTLSPQAVTFDANNDPILPSPGYEITIGGVAQFRVDLLSIASYIYTDPGSGITATITNGRAGAVTPEATGANVYGHDQPETVTLNSLFFDPINVPLTVPETDRLTAGPPADPINSTTFTIATPLGDFPLGGMAMRASISALGGLATGNIKFGEWVNPSSPNTAIRGYVGFSFTESDGVHYGWVDAEIGPVGSGSNADIQYLEIFGYAYENVAGATILAGQTEGGAVVPLPASALLLGSGLFGLGLLGWRTKRG